MQLNQIFCFISTGTRTSFRPGTSELLGTSKRDSTRSTGWAPRGLSWGEFSGRDIIRWGLFRGTLGKFPRRDSCKPWVHWTTVRCGADEGPISECLSSEWNKTFIRGMLYMICVYTTFS